MKLRTEALSWHIAGDDVVVLDLEGSVYLKLNGSGRLLWERLATPATQADLVTVLVDAYGVDEGRAAADVEAFVADLQHRRLVDV